MHLCTLLLLAALGWCAATATSFTAAQSITPPFPVTSMLTSADGGTLALLGGGTPSVAFYTRAPTEWALQQVLQGVPGGAALAGNGELLAALPTTTGAAITLYARVGLVWTQLQLLSSPWGAAATPNALAFSDLSTLAVLLGPSGTAAVQLFIVAPNGTWVPSVTFPGPASSSYLAGFAAANATVATSATVPKPGCTQRSVAIATRGDDGVWAAPGTFVTARDGGAQDTFGLMPQLSSDGLTLLASSGGTTCARASVSVFRRGVFDWALEATVVPVDGYFGDPFTSSVALASDGRCFATGGTANATAATCASGGSYSTTHVSVYCNDGTATGAWTLRQRVLTDVQAGAPSPCVAAVALTGDSTALFVATTYANGSTAPVLVYTDPTTASSTAVRSPPSLPATYEQLQQQVYTPCCCSLTVSDDGSTLVSGTTLAPTPLGPNSCVSTFTRVESSWVLDTVLPGFVNPGISDDGAAIAALNVTAGSPPSGVTVFSGTKWSQTFALTLPVGTPLGVDFLSPTALAVAVWSTTAVAPCVAGRIIVQLFTLTHDAWIPGDTLIPSGCPFNPSGLTAYAPVVKASATAVMVGSGSRSVGGPSTPEGVVVAWTLSDDGVWTQVGLTGGVGGPGDAFGAAGSFSADGSTLAVGAPANTQPPPPTCPPRAAAYLFTTGSLSRNQSWSQLTQLVPPDGFAGDMMGAGVALSVNGSTALVSSNPTGAACSAQAYIFQRLGDGGGWPMTQRLFPNAATAPCIASVALTFDGEFAFVGTFNASATPTGMTPIIAFRRAPTSPLTAPPPPAVAISSTFPGYQLAQTLYAPCCCDLVVAGDGLTLVSSGTTPQCSAVYTRPAPGGNWTLQQVLSGVINSVLNFDGSLLVGALNPAVPPFVPPTTVVVYARTGIVYQPSQQLAPLVGGATIVGLGHLGDDVFAVATWSGAVPPPAPCTAGALVLQLATVSANTWTPQISLSPSDCPIPLPAFSATSAAPWPLAASIDAVAVSMATTLAGGAVQGVTYVFSPLANGSWAQTKVTASDGGAGDLLGSSLVLSPGEAPPALIAGAPGSQTVGRGAAYVYSVDASGLWAQSQRVASSDNLVGDWFGSSVAASAGGATLVVATATPPTTVNCSDEAYVFVFDAGKSLWLEQQIITQLADGVCVADVGVTPDGATVFVGSLNTRAPKPDGPIFVYVAQTPSSSPSASPSSSASASGSALNF